MARDDRASFAVGLTRFAFCPVARLAIPVLVALMLPTVTARPARAAPLDDVRVELSQVAADLTIKQAAYRDAVRGEKAAAAGDFATLGEYVHAPAIDQMRAQALDLDRRENELSATYGPAYPALVDVHTRRLKLAADLRSELKRLVTSSRSDYEDARAREAALKDSLADLSGRSDLDISDTTLGAPTAPTPEPAAVDKSVTAAPAPTRTAAGLDFLHDFLVVSVAIALLGVFVGLAVMLWRDVRRRGEDAPETAAAPSPVLASAAPVQPSQVEPEQEMPPDQGAARLRDAFILGRIPDVPTAGDDLALSVVDDPESGFAREVERLAARLLPTSNGGHVVSLFPLQRGQGTTSLMICLAEAVARNGFKVLLIDADAEDRGLSRALHAAGLRGLAEVLAGIVPASTLALEQNGVTILPSGRLKFDLRADAEAMAALLAESRGRFDLILLDASPFDAQAGSPTLCRLSDDFGLVACRDGMPRDRFVATVEAAAAFQSFAGIILNREGTVSRLQLANAS